MSAVFALLPLFGMSSDCENDLDEARTAVRAHEKDAIDMVDRASDCFWKAGDSLGYFRSNYFKIVLLYNQKAYPDMLKEGERLIPFAASLAKAVPREVFRFNYALAMASYEIQDLDGCLHYFQEATDLIVEVEENGRQHLFKDFLYYAVSCFSSLGGIQELLGLNSSAMISFAKSQDYLDRMPAAPRRDQNQAFLFFLQSKAIADLQDYPSAMTLLQMSIQKFEDLEQKGSKQWMDCKSDEAYLLGEMGHWEAAEEVTTSLLDRCRRQENQNMRFMGIAKDNLARIYSKQGKLELAAAWHLDALLDFESMNQVPLVDVATTWLNLAVLDRREGDFKKARDLLRQALGVFNSASVGKIDLKVQCHLEMAQGFLLENRPDSALWWLQEGKTDFLNSYNIPPSKSIDAKDLALLPADYLQVMSLLGESYRQAFQQSGETVHLREAFAAYREAIRFLAIQEDHREYLGYASHAFDRMWPRNKATVVTAITTALDLHSSTGDPDFLYEALLFSDLSKANLLQKGMRAKLPTDPEFPIDPAAKAILLQRQIDELTRQEWMLHAKMDSSGLDQALLGRIAVQIPALRIELKKLASKTPIHRSLPFPSSILDRGKASQVARLLLETGDSTAFMEYFWGEDQVLVFALGKFGLRWASLGHPENLEPRVMSFIQACSEKPATGSTPPEWDRGLLQVLLPPSFFEPYISRLVIVADGPLTAMPFGALPLNLPEGGFLVDKYALSFDFSLAAHFQSRLRAQQLPLPRIASGLYPRQPIPIASGRLPAIPDGNELATLKPRLALDLRRDSAANKEAALKCLRQADICHFSVHGLSQYLPNLEEKLSFLAFYDQGGMAASNHQLSEYELFDCKGIRCRLVTLGSCQSDSGKYRFGEGMLSLARGFRMASVPSVLASRWEATIGPTQRIYRRFYQEASDGTPLDKALSKAIRNYLKEEKYSSVGRHPFFWAHVSLNGDRSAFAFPFQNGHF